MTNVAVKNQSTLPKYRAGIFTLAFNQMITFDYENEYREQARNLLVAE